MRIASSDIMMSSSHTLEQTDITSSQVSSLKQVSQSGDSNQTTDTGAPLALVDRVSISFWEESQALSGYASTLRAASTVSTGETDGSTTTDYRETVEKLVGAVIDKKVVAGAVQQTGASLSKDLAAGDLSSLAENTKASAAGVTRQWLISQAHVEYEKEQANFSAAGTVTTQDGRNIDFSLEFSMERTLLSETEQETLIQVSREILVDPLVISLDKGVPALSDVTFDFDLDSDGEMDTVHFASSGSGFLSLDKNNDGIINNGSELFGTKTGDGFGELSAYDEDGNGWIDESDAVFEQLQVWTRDDTGTDHLISLKDAGIGAIFLGSTVTELSLTGEDNHLAGQVRTSGLFLFETGEVGSIQQIDLAKQQETFQDNTLSARGTTLINDGFFLNSTGVGTGTLAQGFEWIADNPAGLPEQPENPLEQLKERVKELKQQLKSLLRSTGSLSASMYGKKQAGAFRLYRMTRLGGF